MLARATENAVAGHIWPAGCYLPTSALAQLTDELRLLAKMTKVNFSGF